MIARAVIAATLCLLVALPAAADRAAAAAAVRDGHAALNRAEFEAALAAYTRARDLDPTWYAGWSGMAMASLRLRGPGAGMPFIHKAAELDPHEPDLLFIRSQIYVAADRYLEARADLEEAIRLVGDKAPIFHVLLGNVLVSLGEVDEGLAVQTRTIERAGGVPQFRLRMRGFWMKTEWAEVVEDARAQIGAGSTNPLTRLFLVRALVEQGKFAEAEQAIAELDKLPPGNIQGVSRGYLRGTPGAGAAFDPEEAVRAAQKIVERTSGADELNVLARAHFFAGRPGVCLDLLSAKGSRANFETLFWLGAAQWRLEQYADARATFADAFRRNPYLERHAGRIPGLAPFLALVVRDLADEQAADGDAERRQYELATHLFTVADIETLVRRYQFARAVGEFDRLLPLLGSPVRKAEIETRLPEVRGMAAALDKLVAAVNDGSLKLKTRVEKLDLTLVKADADSFSFKIPKGEGKFLWASLGAKEFCGFAGQATLTPAERLGLACLAWDSGRPELAVPMFEAAASREPGLRGSIHAFVARRRGIPVPDDGFVVHQGSYVTPEEKTHLAQGLVRYRGEWVTLEVRDKLSRGLLLVSGKWVPGAEPELLKRGYVKYKNKWMDRADYDALRSEWANAWREETEHYTVVTNTSEAFARDLAALIEVAYREYRAFYAGLEPKLPGKEKMTLYAFRTFEDYRRHCIEHQAEAHLNGGGFASSDTNVVVGWDKTGSRKQFLQTMVHEAAHLYWFRVAPGARAPSWFAESMATYFEGFSWDGKEFVFDYLADGRLPYARNAMKSGKAMRLADLLAGNALELINHDTGKALLFYAQCWSLNYFLSQTTDPAYREAYGKYRAAIAAGEAPTLTSYFSDAAKLERDWERFVLGL